MYAHATKSTDTDNLVIGHTPVGQTARSGSALVSSLIIFVGIFGMLYATTLISMVDLEASQDTVEDVRAKYLAESGFERGMHFLQDVVKKNDAYSPMAGLSNLFAGADTITPYSSEPLLDGNAQVGAYSVSLTRVAETASSITIEVAATGYLPEGPGALGDGEFIEHWDAITVTVLYSLEASQVFDYAYFINNWGWFYGNTIIANGSVRSNGQFDVAGYQPSVNGQPLYSEVDWDGSAATLSGYQDDNEDGLMDGNDGGVFSGWDIVDAQNLRGSGGQAMNQHDYVDQVPMPNLSDLTQYEERATDAGSSITIAGVQVSDSVHGDGAGELENLYLVGTAADPIVLDGPLVVRGDVIISGYVTGQGAIYSGGNIYVPDSITYVNPPTSVRPTGTTQAETEAWLADNWNADFLGLFARENIAVGDITHSWWQHYVGGWMSSDMNKSEEDAGEDGIPNTRAGRDGIMGTADDDILEGDGLFSVEYYSDLDLTLGLIPPGSSVGDPIPGSGEDIDGDGVYDGTVTLSDIDFTTTLDSTNWGGNMPAAGVANYSDIATLYASNLDATFYTNHSFSYLVLGGSPARINGALVSRNENIVYGTPALEFNHDSRLLGGNSGLAGDLLPQVIASPAILRWRQLDEDPNRYLGIE